MKPTLVFIHGVGLDPSMWDGVISKFGNDARCHAVPMAGHGGTAPPTKPTLEGYVQRLKEQLSHIGDKPVILIGYSMGAMVAATFSANHQDQVEKLVMMNAIHRRDAAARAALQQRLINAEKHGLTVVADAAIPRWFSAQFQAEQAAVVAMQKRVLLANDLQNYLTAYRVFATADEHVADALPKIGCPVLAITGEKDVNSTPEMSAAIAKTCPNGRAIVLADLAHGAPIEAPGHVADELRAFLCDED